MGDLLKKGGQWLEQMHAAHCSSPITYRRGAQEQSLSATYGRTAYEIQDEYGVIVTTHAMDFLISAEGFPFGEPQAGDKIVADGVTYEVMNLGAEGHWRWSDPYRTTMRIHAREVSTA